MMFAQLAQPVTNEKRPGPGRQAARFSKKQLQWTEKCTDLRSHTDHNKQQEQATTVRVPFLIRPLKE